MDEFQKLRRNIARRIFLALVIALIPSYMIVLAIHYVTVERVQNMTLESVAAEAGRHLDNLQSSFDQILSFQREHMTNIDFYRLVLADERMDNQRKTNIIRDTQARLAMAESVSGKILSVHILVPSLRCTIGSSSYTSSVDMDEFAMVSDYANFFGRNMLMLGERLLISVPLPELIVSKAPPLYVTEVEIDRKALVSELSGLEAYERSAVILMSANGQLLAANTQALPLIEDCARRTSAGGAGDPLAVIDGERYYVSAHRSEALDMHLVAYMPRVGIDGMMQKYYLFFALAILVAVSTIALFSYWEYLTLYKPLRMLVGSFANLGTGDFQRAAIQHSRDDAFYYLYSKYNEMNAQLRRMVEVVYEKQIQTQRAELRNLQSQINPHMLSNSFFTLYQMAKLNDMPHIMSFSSNLSRYYRMLTRTASEVELWEEIEYARLFVEINAILHFSEIETVFDPLPEGARHLVVPKLIVQPLIENAYRHARLSKAADARVRVECGQGADSVWIRVSDNGQGIEPDKLRWLRAALAEDEPQAGDISGLVNVHRRLRLSYGAPYGLSVDSAEGGGFVVLIELPCGRKADS